MVGWVNGRISYMKVSFYEKGFYKCQSAYYATKSQKGYVLCYSRIYAHFAVGRKGAMKLNVL